MDKVELSIEEVSALATRCLRANGCDEANAKAVAATVTSAEADGSAAHGLFRLPGYVASLRSGKVDGAASPRVEQVAPSVVRVDGGGGFAPLALTVGRSALVECARRQGVAALALVNIHHFAALWIEVEALVAEDLAAFAFTAYMPAVAPAGSTRAFFGTNPMAFGWPRDGGPGVVFDQASAAMARGEVMIAARDGHPVPIGAGLDAGGKATTDPKAILEGGTLLPFGGHKGSAIALMVELLAAGLLGQPFSFEAAENDNRDGGPPRGGELIIALDPTRFGDASGWRAHCESFFERLLALEGVRLPGSRRHALRATIAAGKVSIPAELHQRIVTLCSGN